MTTSEKKILVTGATGNVGYEVLQLLKEAGAPIIVGARNIERARKSLGTDLDYVHFDFEDQLTYKGALENANKIFLVRPPVISDIKRYFHPFLDLAKEMGVEQIVFLSLLGVEKNKVVPHHKIEKYIMELEIPYTFLRASFFMQNLNTTHQEDIKGYNELCMPAGNGKTSFIDVRDIAEVGALALLEDGHLNKAYPLTGNEALSYYEIAESFSRVLGRKIVYSNPSIFTFYRKMRKRGIKPGFILVMIALYSTARFGLAKQTTDDLEKLLGRKPITVEEYVTDYRECWE